VAAEHEVDVLGQETELQLGARAGGSFLRVQGPRPGQSQGAQRERRREVVDGWLGRFSALDGGCRWLCYFDYGPWSLKRNAGALVPAYRSLHRLQAR
jgi:hypothetical protein